MEKNHHITLNMITFHCLKRAVARGITMKMIRHVINYGNVEYMPFRKSFRYSAKLDKTRKMYVVLNRARDIIITAYTKEIERRVQKNKKFELEC